MSSLFLLVAWKYPWALFREVNSGAGTGELHFINQQSTMPSNVISVTIMALQSLFCSQKCLQAEVFSLLVFLPIGGHFFEFHISTVGPTQYFSKTI